MLTSAVVDVLANVLLSAERETDVVSARLAGVLGRNWRWIRPLVGRYRQTFAGHVRPRHRDVVSFLRRDRGLFEAWNKYGHQIKIVHWIAGPQCMQPVAAAQTWPIPLIESEGALAEWLELTPSELRWMADVKGLGYKCPQPRLEHYHYRVLQKTSGSIRLIETPKPRLKELQRRILSAILDRVPAHRAAHGFVKGRSIRTFAAPHVSQRVVLRMDLKNFFPTFPGARIQTFFRALGYPETVADLLGGVATNSVPRAACVEAIRQAGFTLTPQELWQVRTLYARPHLPQGAPTSPSLANLCSYRLDCRLMGLAHSACAVYTRYADDLAFSGGESFDRSVDRFANHVAVILMEEGFTVHHRKTRIMRPSVRQHLAGLITNQRLNVRRSDFDLLKAILTNCVRHGPGAQNHESHPHFREHLAGRIGFIETINPEKGSRLRAILSQIKWD